MEDNFNQNDFEEFLKEQVKNHRMYPTDAVWRDINRNLHGDKKWPALTIAAFVLLSATIAISVYFTPKPDIFAINPSNIELKNSTLPNSQPSIALNNLTSSSSSPGKNEAFSEVGNALLPIEAGEPRDLPSTEEYKVSNHNNIETVGKIKDRRAIVLQGTGIHVQPGVDPGRNESRPAVNAHQEITSYSEDSPLAVEKREIITFKGIKPSTENHEADKVYNDKDKVDNFLKDHKNDISLHTSPKSKTLKNKFGFQIYIAPSVSYRKLIEDRSILKEGNNTGPVGLNYVADVNKVVRHKPGNGLEAGVSIMYYLSDNFRIKSGLQFNVRQYSIDAYRSGTELASIALVDNNRIDTVNTIAIYRNNNGYYSTELINRYYQLAIPIGVEWEIIGNKRIQLNVAGSIQPTYLINHKAYLLSTNFKNYSENPEMVRSFNINSNIETFISFKVGDYKWQLGPQLRYQPYSTFIPQYPIKEHLLDYGIKLGLSKTFR